MLYCSWYFVSLLIWKFVVLTCECINWNTNYIITAEVYMNINFDILSSTTIIHFYEGNSILNLEDIIKKFKILLLEIIRKSANVINLFKEINLNWKTKN